MTSYADLERETRNQVGALPFQRFPDHGLRVLLITSRESRRWVIPKGWPMKGRKPFEAAAREAYEEAGLLGQIGKRPLGFYLYEKRLKSRDSVLCQVKVFPLEVRKHSRLGPSRTSATTAGSRPPRPPKPWPSRAWPPSSARRSSRDGRRNREPTRPRAPAPARRVTGRLPSRRDPLMPHPVGRDAVGAAGSATLL